MMRPMTLGEIAAAVGCTDSYFLDNNAKITSISTDSRPQPEDGDRESCLFVALRGEVFDGHAYVGAALRNKAQYALVDKKGVEEYCKELPAQQLIVCEDTEQGFLDLAGAYRDRYHFRMVGVTGSVGKTTTKEMIAQVLSAQFETLKTQGNFNNRVGLPKTLLELDETVQAAVIEMGMNHFGEISDLTRRAKPDAAVITNIGVAHIEYLGSREGILKAKMEITKGLAPGSPLILNGDDDLLPTLKETLGNKVVTFGLGPNCDWRAYSLKEADKGTFFTCQSPSGEKTELFVPAAGEHNVRNALSAMAVARYLEIPAEDAVRAIATYKAPAMRQQVIEANGLLIIDDSYNASPDSMRSAIDVLSTRQMPGRKAAVLADMLELGDFAHQGHREVGEYARSHGVELLVAVGPLSKEIAAGYGEGAVWFETNQQAIEYLKGTLRPGDALLVKGSRGMATDQIVAALKE